MGVSLAVCVHISYSLLGISYLISQNELLFSLIRYLGAAYLVYLGVKSIYCAGEAQHSDSNSIKASHPLQFLAQGFLCNVLNPKTMLFFLSIFSQVVTLAANEHQLTLLYGFYMVALHCVWFAIVAVLFTSKTLQAHLVKMRKRINQVCGAGLLSFGVLLALK